MLPVQTETQEETPPSGRILRPMVVGVVLRVKLLLRLSVAVAGRARLALERRVALPPVSAVRRVLRQQPRVFQVKVGVPAGQRQAPPLNTAAARVEETQAAGRRS